MSSGGGSSTPTQQNITQTNIPAYAQPYVMQMLGQASALTQQPYQQYAGQQVAGFNPLQQQAYGNLQQMQPSGLGTQAAGLAGMGATNQFTGANVNQFMSPYIGDVVAQQQQGAVRDYARQLPGMAGVATQMGGLGGSREALVNSEAQRNLQQQLQGITASGYQNAFQNAQGQFNQQNQNLMQGAGILGNLGQQNYQQQMGINQAQLQGGAQQQALQQQLLNTGYQNYMNQVNYPYQNLGFLSSLIHGLPIQQMGTTQYAAPGNILGQATAAAGGLGTLFSGLGAMGAGGG